MLNFTPADIRSGATVTTREDAIRAVVDLSAEHAAIDPAYAASMLGREQAAGVPWKSAEKARPDFGIAARSDEHLGLLVRVLRPAA